ncbi:uncharacterized protein BXZ73DRAFT_100170 [Epithele typhae]|uniref:uncharacterized protein n=1 Tax=Epithele typhae TaxID=378194 RepID=UPI0020078563|nr:uncharacterized protein BXZ73DRAFT_100170 [Epithele typhae]KAH9936749.1 hypothetical protein BXZ73DRAFT_100170 [Epithele typhae]
MSVVEAHVQSSKYKTLLPPKSVDLFNVYVAWEPLPRRLNLKRERQSNNTVEHAFSAGQTHEKRSLPRAHGKTIVSNKDCIAEEVEATTGVAMLAKDDTPVHHHHSTGLRRSGVFIVIDAVHHKMQKRKEGQVEDSAPWPLSEAPTDAMEVDPPTKDDAQPTVPVCFGHCEVDGPVAGFTPDAMDVDAHSRPAPASSELVEEDRRAAVGVSPAAPRAQVAAFCLAVFEWWQQQRLASYERVGWPPELRHPKNGDLVRQRPGIVIDELRSPFLVNTARADGLVAAVGSLPALRVLAVSVLCHLLADPPCAAEAFMRALDLDAFAHRLCVVCPTLQTVFVLLSGVRGRANERVQRGPKCTEFELYADRMGSPRHRATEAVGEGLSAEPRGTEHEAREVVSEGAVQDES